MTADPFSRLLQLIRGNGEEDPPPDDADPYAEIRAANDKVRETAMWIVTSFAAIGAVLLGGIQLSNVGKLTEDVPEERISATIAGVVLAGLGVGIAIWFTSSVLVPFLNSFRTLDKHQDVAKRVLDDKEILGLTYEQLKAGVTKARNDVEAAEGKSSEEYAAALALWKEWENSKQAALTVVGSELLADRFRDARVAVLAGVGLATLGLGLFAWGANPPESESDAPVALARAPVVLNITLTEAGVTALQESRNCTRKNFNALAIGGKEAAWEIVTLPGVACRSVRFILTPSIGSAVAAG